MNIRDLLIKAAAQLEKAGSASPRLDAEVMLAAYLNTDRLELYKAPEKILGPEEAAGFGAWLERRRQGEPVAYIVGVKEFWSLPFKVSPAVLIPRPETEILVEEALAVAKEAIPPVRRILEIGVGSGAISVALAKELPAACLTATDLEAGALSLARENACRLGVEERITFLRGHLFAPLSGTFDMIVSNPPYIAAAEFARLPKGVKDYEPRAALLAGESGTACHREIIAGCGRLLREGGWLLMEMGEGQGAEITGLLKQRTDFVNIAIRRDYGGVERVIRARKAGAIG